MATFAAESTSNNMVTQKSIHVKVDGSVWRQLEAELAVSGGKRNRIINQAVAMYIAAADAVRTARCLPSTVYPHPALRAFLKQWVAPMGGRVRTFRRHEEELKLNL